MVAATDYELPGFLRTANPDSISDTRLFWLINELAGREKRRDALLDRMLLHESDAIEVAAKKACDDARAIYARIAAIKPTTAGGVLRQLELAARGWIAPSTVPTAMTALREIVDRPPPFKAGQLPPVPPSAATVR